MKWSKNHHQQKKEFPILNIRSWLLSFTWIFIIISSASFTYGSTNTHLRYYRMADEALLAQEYDMAISSLKTAVLLNSDAAEPHFYLGKSYLQIGEKNKAIFHFEQYLFLGGDKEEEVQLLLSKIKGLYPR